MLICAQVLYGFVLLMHKNVHMWMHMHAQNDACAFAFGHVRFIYSKGWRGWSTCLFYASLMDLQSAAWCSKVAGIVLECESSGPWSRQAFWSSTFLLWSYYASCFHLCFPFLSVFFRIPFARSSFPPSFVHPGPCANSPFSVALISSPYSFGPCFILDLSLTSFVSFLKVRSWNRRSTSTYVSFPPVRPPPMASKHLQPPVHSLPFGSPRMC